MVPYIWPSLFFLLTICQHETGGFHGPFGPKPQGRTFCIYWCPLWKKLLGKCPKLPCGNGNRPRPAPPAPPRPPPIVPGPPEIIYLPPGPPLPPDIIYVPVPVPVPGPPGGGVYPPGPGYVTPPPALDRRMGNIDCCIGRDGRWTCGQGAPGCGIRARARSLNARRFGQFGYGFR